MLRRLLNRAGDALFAPGLDHLWIGRLRGRVLCLVYHRVAEGVGDFLDWGGVPTMSADELAADLSRLRSWGVRFMTLAELREGRTLDPDAPNIIISFDDGLRDTYENGLQVLDALGIKGVVFQVGELIDGGELNWEHALYRYAYLEETRERLRQLLEALLPADVPKTRDMQSLVKFSRDTIETSRLLFMLDELKAEVADQESRSALAAQLYPTRATLRTARQNGHEIGSHSMQHIARRFLDADAFRQDLEESCAAVEDAAGVSPGAYAYPFGCHDRNDAEVLAGIYDQAALATSGTMQLDEPYALNRCLWPGPARNELRRRRWLLTGRI